MKNVLVTGGKGFLGSHLCDYLHFRGYRVSRPSIWWTARTSET